MSLLFPLPVLCALAKASKLINALFPRTLTTLNHQYVSDPEDDFVSLNNQISSFAESVSAPDGLNAVAWLQQLNESSRSPYFLSKIISHCKKSRSLDVGIQIHPIIVKKGFTSNLYICTALVDMYGNCGEILSSQRLFDEMQQRNIVTWNSLISGYLHVKSPDITVELFIKMLKAGIEPTAFSVSIVLVGCSQLEDEVIGAQCGEQALKCFSEMRRSGNEIDYFTFTSIVGAIGVISGLKEGKQMLALILKTGYARDVHVQNALVSIACQIHGSREIAERSAKKLLELWPNDPATYVILSNVFKMAGYWDDAIGLRALMCDRRVRIKPGYSWV
ncbi:hypothetical protein Patl1_31291 [Pistacia atlantica]|uniref:Uncharacterized protein n=1 Tax=Pistacia atlantica TaxID=434234 RepID=A0ACC1AAE2_9ROSI|nr:hypothetical protein Patl1_31291 [Pistacia atlantica]